jgi:hypothetical protein
MDSAERTTSTAVPGPQFLTPPAPSAALVALRAAVSAELEAWADAENKAFAALPPSLDFPVPQDHRPAHVGQSLTLSAQTFTLDFLAATEGERFVLRLVEAYDDPQQFIQWLMQLPELKRTYGFDTVAGLVVLREKTHAQLDWQTVLARAYDATYFVDPVADGPALQDLAHQIVTGLFERGSTARLWDLWEHERTETDRREYALGKDFLQWYVSVDDAPDWRFPLSTIAPAWGQVAGTSGLLDLLTAQLDAAEIPYDRDVPGGVNSPLLRRYMPGFTWPLVIDNRFCVLYMDVPTGPVRGAELVQWTTLARCTRYWLDKAGDLRWNERTWIPLLVLSAPIIGQPYNRLSPVELLAEAGWCLVAPAQISTPQRLQETLDRAAHRPVV